MKINAINILLLLAAVMLSACGNHVPDDAIAAGRNADIYPDYSGVTVPSNIAPLNFRIDEAGDKYVTRVVDADGMQLVSSGKTAKFDIDKWHDMLAKAQGDTLRIEVYVRNDGEWHKFNDMPIAVAGPIDPYISYRLIEPSYISFEKMGIYQRNLENYDEKPIFTNSSYSDPVKGQCVNCHACQDYNKGGNTQFHVRVSHGGTMIVRDGTDAKLVNLKTDATIGPGVYPSWHPTLPLIAYSVNKTNQLFHSKDLNKIEVQDAASDLILYDVDANEVSIIANDSTKLECFPYWNHDGTALYYVSASLPEIVNSDNISQYKKHFYKDIRYDVFRLPFDTVSRRFGEVDTVFMASAREMSATHPRESRDGKFLMITLAPYGVFHVWHKEADLYLIDLENNRIRPLNEVNSDDMESYHSFSSSGEWFMFTSRRDDGHYTRLYISHFDKDGNATKPFLLPQRDPEENILRYKSYNVPEFMACPVTIGRSALLDAVEKDAQPAKLKQ